MLARLLREGMVERLHRGVYRFTSTPETWKAQLMAAVLAAGEGAVVSHEAAADLLGITRVPRPEQPVVTRPDTTTCTIRDVTVHRTRKLERHDWRLVDGIPCTTGARTLIDLAATVDRAEITAITDEAVCRRAVRRDWLYRRALAAKNGRTGVGNIIRIAKPDAEGEFWSWLERRFDEGVVQAFALPVPAYNAAVVDETGRVGVADAWWCDPRVVVELLGLAFHSLPAERQRDMDRRNRYALARIIPLEFTWEDVVKRPEHVAGQIRQALTRGVSISAA